jgi:hypothetical protein
VISSGARSDSLGAEVHRVQFAVQNAKRFVLSIFGGLTLMVTLWAGLTLESSVLLLEGESRTLFKAIAVFFVALIVVGFTLAWWVLSRNPHAFVVREHGAVLAHGSRTRLLRWSEVRGIDQRDDGGTPTYVLLIADGSEISFGSELSSREAAHAIVLCAGLEWTEEPLKASRPVGATPTNAAHRQSSPRR